MRTRTKALLIGLVVLLVAVPVYMKTSREAPKPASEYGLIERVIAAEVAQGWTVREPPDIDGPFKRSKSLPIQGNPGRPLVVSIGTVSFRVEPAENESILAVFVVNEAGREGVVVMARTQQTE